MKNCLSIVFFLVYLSVSGYAQGYSTSNKKAVKLFEEAKSNAGNGLYARSLQLLHEALEMDSTFFEAYLLSSDIYQEIDSIHLQVKALETAVRMRSTKYPKVFYTLGNAYYASGNYQKAIGTYSQYLEEVGPSGTFVIQARRNMEKSSQAVYLVNNPVPFNIKSLGPNINSADDDYWPSLTVDGQMIIYTRLIGSGNFAGPVPDMLQEDFFTSQLVDSVWQKSEPVASVNTRDNEGAQSISSDGKLLFFTACGRRDGVGSCDIYFSRNKDGNWSEPRNAGVPVSSGTWESQPSISANGKVLYFVSNRKGGKGGMDIWKCNLLAFSEKGFPVWGTPVNLGDSVNTAGNENSPFIHPDNQTLYFASDHWAGLGGYDIFYCRKLNEFTWTKPRNIGYPINSYRDEQGLVVDASGRNAYYSSDRKGSQRRDIYTFELHPDAQPVPVTYIKGMVTDAATGEPLCATVELVDLQDTTSHSTVESCWEPGQFLVSLPLGREYAFTVAKEGYLFYSENYQLKEIMEYIDPYIIEIKLQKIEPGNAVVLRNVFFKIDSYELLPESMSELDRLVALLKSNPTIQIALEGHTDNVGSEQYNLNLSEDRAHEVHHYLVNKGIASERISYKGYGFSRPVSENDSPEGRAMNRRTEFRIIRK